MTIFKPCFQTSSKDPEIIYQLFARIPYNSYFRKRVKYDISDFKEDTYPGVPLQQTWTL